MSRRTTLPGAAELFRATSGAALADSAAGVGVVEIDQFAIGDPEQRPRPLTAAPPVQQLPSARSSPTTVRRTTRRRPGTAGEQSPSGRERHEEKITVYCSAEELLDLESARLALRAEHGLAVDRGRIVREALAVVLADLRAKGESSVLVRRLSGR
ncbi:MAG: hypothetical protein M3Z50_12095 [Actinomycetota bacterium]|nr:hypothetical protein [Actinomycetota bacterium]